MVGVARAVLEHEQFGQSIACFGGTQEKLAEMSDRVAVTRVLTHAAGVMMAGVARRRGPDSFTEYAAMAKLTESEAALWVADEAVQVFGGYGYMRDYPVEKLMRDAKGTEIFEVRAKS